MSSFVDKEPSQSADEERVKRAKPRRDTDYSVPGFTNHGLVLKRRMERGIEDGLTVEVKSDVEKELRRVIEDGLTVEVKSDVEKELRRVYPAEEITDEAGRLVVKEVLEFRARYPGLESSKNVRRRLAEDVIACLRLLHPQLRPVTTLPGVGA